MKESVMTVMFDTMSNDSFETENYRKGVLIRFTNEKDNKTCSNVLEYKTEDQSLYIVVYTILILTSIAGTYVNGTWLLLTILNHDFRSHKYHLLIGLTCANFFISAILIPFDIYVNFFDSCWTFGWIACRIYANSDMSMQAVQMLCLLCIAIDRYCLIAFNKAYREKESVMKKIKLVSLFGSWIISFFVFFMYTFTTDIPSNSNVLNSKGAYRCWAEYKYHFIVGFKLFFNVALITLLISICITYTLVLRLYLKHSKFIISLSHDEMKAQNKKHFIRGVLKTIGIIMSFTIFHIPHIMIQLLQSNINFPDDLLRVQYEFIYMKVLVIPFVFTIEPFNSIWLKVLQCQCSELTEKSRRRRSTLIDANTERMKRIRGETLLRASLYTAPFIRNTMDGSRHLQTNNVTNAEVKNEELLSQLEYLENEKERSYLTSTTTTQTKNTTPLSVGTPISY